MAYPYQIDDPGDRVTWGQYGAFCFALHNGSYYSVLMDDIANTIEVRKSTDRGLNWAEVDTANHKSVPNLAGHKFYSAVHLGNEIHVLYIASNMQLAIATFSMLDDLWKTVRGGGPDYTGWSTTAASLYGLYLQLVVRSADEPFVVCYNSEPYGSPSNYARASVVLCTYGGAWGTPVDIVAASPVTENYSLMGAALGLDNVVHIIITKFSPVEWGHVYLDINNVLGAYDKIFDLATQFPGFGVYSINNFPLGGAEIVWAIGVYNSTGAGTGELHVVRAQSELSPTWTVQEVETRSNHTLHQWQQPVLDGVGTLILVWARNDGTAATIFQCLEFYYCIYDATSPAGWGTPVMFYTTAFFASPPPVGDTVAAGQLPYGIGVIMGRLFDSANDLPALYWEKDTTGLGPGGTGAGGNFVI